MPAPLISIIGPPAVGKTTLARGLAEEMDARLICEDFEGNPFLADSYLHGQDTCLPAQLFFLLSRVNQLSLAGWPESGLVVSDYGFCQDRIYAAVKLTQDEMSLYSKLADRVSGLVRPVSVILHLDAPEAVLESRIAARGREYETAMTLEFLHEMRMAYNEIDKIVGCPVICVDTGATDLRCAEARSGLIAEIRGIMS
ncbi:MAG: deoxynucleoside kinase [Phycisphaerales bacterium]|jgi:deoxyguanosine kinase|nr:deoxynucleoside kinase [Phycisphaerales bacterium]